MSQPDDLPDLSRELAETGRGSLQRRVADLEALVASLRARVWADDYAAEIVRDLKRLLPIGGRP